MLDDAWRAESESWVDHEGGEEEGGDSEVLRPNFTVRWMMRKWNQGFKAWTPPQIQTCGLHAAHPFCCSARKAY